ncbi:HTTM domain-containing protein [Nocardioides humi]|uniref:HTTM-like domain-containing protein n=1 Tax=Nocardioides humi TaxID=449461 RepID=A0ABN2AR50_9ACTN|nr:HTTM domain-containing protein [Nocardioides humi]
MLTAVMVPAGPVAWGRMLLAAGAALTCVEGAVQLSGLQDGRIRVPVSGGLLSPEALPAGPWLLVMATACLLLLLGAASRLCTATLAVGNVLLLLADQQLYSNHRLLLVLLCVWFLLARADHARSLRALLRPARGGRDAEVPWWPQLLIVATVSACYVFAGLSKLNPEFLSGDLVDSMSPDWVPAGLLAWASVPTEVAIGAGIWWRATRRWVLGLGVLLHLSIIALLGAPLVFAAFALLCLSAYPSVWTWPRLPQDEAAATQRSRVA